MSKDTKSNLDKLLRTSQVTNHKLSHKFSWPLPYQLTLNDAKEMHLIKGVAMSEGTLKSGEIMTRDNVVHGAGGMRASALLGFADLDIDHIKDKLPETYTTKYGKEINDTYPPGFIIDAQAVENEIDGKKLMQVEFLAVITNPHVYSMIEQGKFKGCSVEDAVRELNCGSDCKGDSCSCNYEGSAYIANTLILDEVPNSNSTWVSVVDESDIGSVIVSESDDSKLESLKHSIKDSPTGIQIRLLRHIKSPETHHSHKNHESDLSNYMTDGTWNDGVESIVSFLTEQKEIDEDTAKLFSAYLFENLTLLSQYQLETLSTEDLLSYWANANKIKTLENKINHLVHSVSMLHFLKLSDAEKHKLKQLKENNVPYGQTEVNYGSKSSGSQCQDCRFYTSHYDDDTVGYCAIVAGDVAPSMGCDKLDPLPALSSGGDVNDEPVDNADEEEDDDTVTPDEDGNCPDGYKLSEDKTICVKVETPKEEKIPEKHSLSKSKKFSTPKIEQNPQTHSSVEDNKLDESIKQQLSIMNRLESEMKHMPTLSAKTSKLKAKYLKAQNEYNRLTKLKKRS